MLTAHFDYICNYQLTTNNKVPMHNHNIYELVFFLEGEGETFFSGKSHTYEQGHCILYSPLTMHDEQHRTATKTCCLGFVLSDEILPTAHLKKNTAPLFALKDRIFSELKNKEPNYPEMLDVITKEMAITISRMNNMNDSHDDQFCIDSAIKFIDENYHADLSLPKLAAAYAYSYDYFRHLFKARTGIAPNQYLIRKRLERARQLLVKTSDSVQDISLKCGFDNLSQFSYIFKKHYSIPPTVYREHSKSN